MRLVLRFGILSKPVVTDIHASADSGGVTRWFTSSFDVRAALSVLALAGTMLGAYVHYSNEQTTAAAERRQQQVAISALQHNNAELRQQIEQQIAARDSRFDTTVVSRQEYQNVLHLLILLGQSRSTPGCLGDSLADAGSMR